MDKAPTKKTSKKLKELKLTAYQRELDEHLSKLSAKFNDWKNKKITAMELRDHIYDFDKGPSTKISGFYDHFDDHICVARAVAIGLLKKEEVPENILESIDRNIDSFRGLEKI